MLLLCIFLNWKTNITISQNSFRSLFTITKSPISMMLTYHINLHLVQPPVVFQFQEKPVCLLLRRLQQSHGRLYKPRLRLQSDPGAMNSVLDGPRRAECCFQTEEPPAAPTPEVTGSSACHQLQSPWLLISAHPAFLSPHPFQIPVSS